MNLAHATANETSVYALLLLAGIAIGLFAARQIREWLNQR